MARKKSADGAEDKNVKKDDVTAEKPAKAPKGKSSMMPSLVLAVAVVFGGAMAGGVIGGGGGEAEAVAPEPTPTEEERIVGPLTQLESITLNLDTGHFLKLGLAVESAPPSTEEAAAEGGEEGGGEGGGEEGEPTLATAPIYDLVIDLFGDMTFEGLSAPGVRDATKVEMLDALHEIYGEEIVAVYFTEFVMQ